MSPSTRAPSMNTPKRIHIQFRDGLNRSFCLVWQQLIYKILGHLVFLSIIFDGITLFIYRWYRFTFSSSPDGQFFGVWNILGVYFTRRGDRHVVVNIDPFVNFTTHSFIALQWGYDLTIIICIHLSLFFSMDRAIWMYNL